MKRKALIGIGIVSVALLIPIEQTVDVEVKVKPIAKARTKATMEEKRQNRSDMARFAYAGWGWDKVQRNCLRKLWYQESRYDHFADNPKSSAYGIAQLLGEKSTDPHIQILRGLQYIEHRYGTPCKAYKHHLRKNWY